MAETASVHFNHDLPRVEGDDYVEAVKVAESFVNRAAITHRALVKLSLAFLMLHDEKGEMPAALNTGSPTDEP